MGLKMNGGNQAYQQLLRRQPSPKSIPPKKTKMMLDAQDPRHASPELPAMGGEGVGRVLHKKTRVTCPGCGMQFGASLPISQSSKGPTPQ